MGESVFEYKSLNHGTNLNDMRMNNNWCDVTIIVNDTKYRAHKIVLATNLKYFKSKLLNSPEHGEQDIIDMTGVKVTFIKYNSVANKWRKCPSMCERRIRPVVTVLDEKLYACGGLDVKSVKVYEPARKSWRKVSSMNKQRDHFLVVAYDGKLFAIGGDTEMTVEVYDPIEDKWQIDQEASSGLQIEHPKGGLISEKCLRQRALKRSPEPSNEAPLNTDDGYREVQQPSKKIKN